MRFLVAALTCATSSLAMAQEIPASQAWGFKNYSLGMTIEQFRSEPIPHPDGARMRASCDIDSVNNPRLYGHIKQRILAGVVTCTIPQISLDGRYAAYDSSYRFLDGRLVEISFATNINAEQSIVGGLTARYGTATVRAVKLQNAFGTEIPATITSWKRNGKIIEVRAPDGDIRTVSFRATDAAMAAEAEKRSNPPASM